MDEIEFLNLVIWLMSCKDLDEFLSEDFEEYVQQKELCRKVNWKFAKSHKNLDVEESRNFSWNCEISQKLDYSGQQVKQYRLLFSR